MTESVCIDTHLSKPSTEDATEAFTQLARLSLIYVFVPVSYRQKQYINDFSVFLADQFSPNHYLLLITFSFNPSFSLSVYYGKTKRPPSQCFNTLIRSAPYPLPITSLYLLGVPTPPPPPPSLHLLSYIMLSIVPLPKQFDHLVVYYCNVIGY